MRQILGKVLDLEKLHAEIPEIIYFWTHIFRYSTHIWTEFTFTKSASFFRYSNLQNFIGKKVTPFHGNNCAARHDGVCADHPRHGNPVPGRKFRGVPDICPGPAVAAARAGAGFRGNKVWILASDSGSLPEGLGLKSGGPGIAVISIGLWYNPYK